MKYVYIDESGDLGFKKGSSRYFIIAALIVDHPKPLNRIIKNMRRNKFKKKLRKAQEIKANKSSRKLIEYMLKKLNEIKGVRTVYVVLDKRKVTSDYLKNKKDKLYNYVAGRLAERITLTDENVEIRIDKSKGKDLLRGDFNAYFSAKLDAVSKSRDRMTVKMEHSYSHCWSGLQFVDVLAWSCFQKYEHRDSSFIDLVNEKEIYILFNKRDAAPESTETCTSRYTDFQALPAIYTMYVIEYIIFFLNMWRYKYNIGNARA